MAATVTNTEALGNKISELLESVEAARLYR